MEPVLSPLQLSEREILMRIDMLFTSIQWSSVEEFLAAVKEIHKNNPEHFEKYTHIVESRATTCRSIINEALNAVK